MILYRLSLLMFLIPSIGFGAEWFKGENLLTTPLPNEEQYEAYVKEEKGWVSRLWKNKERDGDTYTVNIVSQKRTNLKKFQKSQDDPGRSACSNFTSDVIDEEKRNGYKSVLWMTFCEIGEKKVQSIQLGIAGRDSLYHVRKLWKVPVSDQDKLEWQESIQKISLCDTRKKKNPCPKGYSKVGS